MKFGHRIGILGGGQLARMLILEGLRMGYEMHVLCQKIEEPAAQVTPHYHIGNPHHEDDLISFFQKVDLVTIESEFYEGPLLKKVEKISGTRLFPTPEVITQLQDRLSQKELLIKHNIPTAPFLNVHHLEDLKKAESTLGPFVLKKRTGGYDGNGTFLFTHKKQWNQSLKKINLEQNTYIAEKFIPFKKELAVMLFRNRSGKSMIHFPLVQTQQLDHRCDWVIGPTQHQRSNFLLKKLFSLLESIDYVGAIGFELFDDGKNLLVNEVAPRVHNSGHYSMTALSENQFGLHLKAILDWPLLKPSSLTRNFVMTNLIGSKETDPPIPTHISGDLHWYGKKENRKGRKMGHINYAGAQAKTLLIKALNERKKIKGL